MVTDGKNYQPASADLPLFLSSTPRQVQSLDGKIVVSVNLDRPRVHARQTILHHPEPSPIIVGGQRSLIQVQQQTNLRLRSVIVGLESFPVS